MRRIILIVPFLLLIGAAGYACFKFTQPAGLTETDKPLFTLSASKLFNEFELIETTANAKYKNKIIEVVGRVKEVKRDVDGAVYVVLASENSMFSIHCKLQTSQLAFANEIQKDEEISVKGICKGIMMDVILEECIIE